MKLSKNPKIKQLKLIKLKTPPSLLSFLSNHNREKKQINLIPLSQLLKTKMKKENNKIINFCEKQPKAIKHQIKLNLSNKNSTSALNKYKSLSYKIIPFKQQNYKLPKIKSLEESSSEIKESKIDSIIHKFNEYDNKFKKQSKLSIDAGEIAYMRYKLNQNLSNNFKYEHISLKYNYKKIYSKLFKRIKKMKSL